VLRTSGTIHGGRTLLYPVTSSQQMTPPGTILATLEPLYKGGLEGVTPGSSCIANAYSNNQDTIEEKRLGR